jgi:hypothetical protein
VYSDYGVSSPAKIGLSGMGHACNYVTATFTVEVVSYDAVGNLNRFRVSFEDHCEHAEPALRGTWDFTAAE